MDRVQPIERADDMNKLLNVWISLAILAAASCAAEAEPSSLAGAAGAVAIDREALGTYCSVCQNDNWFHLNFAAPPEGNWQILQTCKNPPAVPQAILYSADRSTYQQFYGSSAGRTCNNGTCDYAFRYTQCNANTNTCSTPQNIGTLHCYCQLPSNAGQCVLQTI